MTHACMNPASIGKSMCPFKSFGRRISQAVTRCVWYTYACMIMWLCRYMDLLNIARICTWASVTNSVPLIPIRESSARLQPRRSMLGDFRSTYLLSTVCSDIMRSVPCSITVYVQYWAECPGLSFLPSPKMQFNLIKTNQWLANALIAAICPSNIECIHSKSDGFKWNLMLSYQ